MPFEILNSTQELKFKQFIGTTGGHLAQAPCSSLGCPRGRCISLTFTLPFFTLSICCGEMSFQPIFFKKMSYPVYILWYFHKCHNAQNVSQNLNYFFPSKNYRKYKHFHVFCSYSSHNVPLSK